VITPGGSASGLPFLASTRFQPPRPPVLGVSATPRPRPPPAPPPPARPNPGHPRNTGSPATWPTGSRPALVELPTSAFRPGLFFFPRGQLPTDLTPPDTQTERDPLVPCAKFPWSATPPGRKACPHPSLCLHSPRGDASRREIAPCRFRVPCAAGCRPPLPPFARTLVGPAVTRANRPFELSPPDCRLVPVRSPSPSAFRATANLVPPTQRGPPPGALDDVPRVP